MVTEFEPVSFVFSTQVNVLPGKSRNLKNEDIRKIAMHAKPNESCMNGASFQMKIY